jgi:hypothetical protein
MKSALIPTIRNSEASRVTSVDADRKHHGRSAGLAAGMRKVAQSSAIVSLMSAPPSRSISTY